LDLLVVDPSNDLAAYLYLKNDNNYLYIAYDAVGDTQEDDNDYASVGFDTGHDGVATEGEDDQFFQSTPNTPFMMMLHPPENQAHFTYMGPPVSDWMEHCNPFDPGQPGHTGLAGNISFATSPRLPMTDHRTYEFRIPLSILGVSAGDTIGFIGSSQPRWGVMDFSSQKNSSWPKFFTSDPTYPEYGDLHLSTLPGDDPPFVDVWRPGEGMGEMYQIGDPITVTWNATDDNLMPVDNINITYGSGVLWTPVANNETNDGAYIWDTAGASPGIYYMNISAYDSMGQTTFNVSNYSFELYLETDPPEIENVLVDGSPSVTYSICSLPSSVVLTATVNDTNTGNSNVSGANYTIGAQTWPGMDMFAADGAFDNPIEDVNITIDITGWSVSTYDFYVYGRDASQNNNTTSVEFATLDIIDDCAPLIENVLLNGQPTLSVTAGDFVTVTATVNDTTTGNNTIKSANYTVGIQSWPGTSMNAVVAPFDNPVEDVISVPDIDTLGWPDEIYDICVYGNDTLENNNTVGSCATLSVAPELIPPEIESVEIDGSPTQTYFLSTLPPTIILTATVNDTNTGGSTIGNVTLGGANYTLGPGNWPSSQPMDAVDGIWENQVIEPVTKTIATPTAGGVYTYCIHGWDEWFNYNTTGLCTQLTIVDDLPPEISDVNLNGSPSLTVPIGTLSVDLTAMLTETNTGQANISGANYTIGAQNWVSAVDMDPTDLAWDEVSEDADKTIDTSGLGAGPHDICVYGWDSVIPQNNNITGSCALLTISADLIAPEIENVLIDGAPTQTYALSSLPSSIVLTATVNDTNTGDSNIGGANYTVGIANWPSKDMDATDGLFNSSIEDVNKTINITGWGVDSYDICVYGWDEVGNDNVTGSCATLIISDDLQPEIENVLIDGAATQTYGLSSLPSNIVLTATVNDANTGGSNISGTNYTIGAQQWGTSQLMSLVSPPTSPTEDFTATVDITGWTPNTYIICVYARDAVPNNNITGSCATLNITDDLPPGVSNVRVNGLTAITVQPGTSVFLNASIDDSSEGNSDIGGANYTFGLQQWASSQPMSLINPPTSPTEDFTATLDTTSWNPNTYTICVYAWDVVPNNNITATECVDVIIPSPDTTPPEISEVSAIPSPQYVGQYVDISANVTDDDDQLTVIVNITTQDGVNLGNFTMSYDNNAIFIYYMGERLE
jgi:hypothetical protein